MQLKCTTIGSRGLWNERHRSVPRTNATNVALLYREISIVYLVARSGVIEFNASSFDYIYRFNPPPLQMDCDECLDDFVCNSWLSWRDRQPCGSLTTSGIICHFKRWKPDLLNGNYNCCFGSYTSLPTRLSFDRTLETVITWFNTDARGGYEKTSRDAKIKVT